MGLKMSIGLGCHRWLGAFKRVGYCSHDLSFRGFDNREEASHIVVRVSIFAIVRDMAFYYRKLDTDR